MCEECRDEQYMKQQRDKAVRCMILSTDFRQMEMEEFLNASNKIMQNGWDGICQMEFQMIGNM